MVLAVLDVLDFAILMLLIVIYAGGRAATTAYVQPSNRDRLERIEDKLDLILKHYNLTYVSKPKTDWQQLADDPHQKIAAIKIYRDQYHVGLAEAKRVVEEYIQGSSKCP